MHPFTATGAILIFHYETAPGLSSMCQYAQTFTIQSPEHRYEIVCEVKVGGAKE